MAKTTIDKALKQSVASHSAKAPELAVNLPSGDHATKSLDPGDLITDEHFGAFVEHLPGLVHWVFGFVDVVPVDSPRRMSMHFKPRHLSAIFSSLRNLIAAGVVLSSGTRVRMNC